MFLFQLIIVLITIFIGARLKGVGLGIMGGLGICIFTFIFNIKPDKPPYDVLLVIIGGISASMALEAAGGLGYLTKIAEKIIKKHPNHITIVAPIVGYIFTIFTGTSHVTYSILPIITDVAIDAGVSPEKPLSATAVASLQAVLASPISAATAITVSLLSNEGITFFNLMLITIPSTICGIIAAIIVSNRFLKNKNINREKLKKEMSNYQQTEINNKSEQDTKAKISVIIFLIGVVLIILTSIPTFTPQWTVDGKILTLHGPSKVAMIMLSVSALIVLICKAKTYKMIRGKVAIAGIQAIIAILGVSWLGKTFFISNIDYIKKVVSLYIINKPWMFAIFLFLTTIISTSQAATLRILLPLAITIGMPIKVLIGLLPAVNSVFVIPGYPTMVAAMEFDKTGSTRVGKYVLNHSFMLPGLASAFITICASILLSKIIL